MTFYEQYSDNLSNLQSNEELVAVEVNISEHVFIDDKANSYNPNEVVHDGKNHIYKPTGKVVRKVSKLYLVYLDNNEKVDTSVRTMYDCSTCKRAIEKGNIVFIDKDLNLHTAWDNIDTDSETENKTAKVLSQYLKALPIVNKLYKSQTVYKFGNRETTSIEAGTVYTHLETVVASKYRVDSIDNARNNTIQYYKDLKRMLDNLTEEHFVLVKDNVTITNNSHINKLSKLEDVCIKYVNINENDKNTYVWYILSKMYTYNDTIDQKLLSGTPMGGILDGLLNGTPIEKVKGIYENSVMNYDTFNRTTRVASVTAREQVDKNLETLGYSRDDFTTGAVAEVDETMSVWSNGDNTNVPRDEVMDRLLQAGNTSKSGKQINGKPVGMKEFINEVLPEASKVEVGVSDTLKHHRAVITKQTQGDKSIFSHGNKYGYMYVSGRTNSVLERVKEQSGELNTPYGFSLAWDNVSSTQGDDLDIGLLRSIGTKTVTMPVSAFPTDYSKADYKSKGSWVDDMYLDVDANANRVNMEYPVENVAVSKLHDGYYYTVVHNFSGRAGNDGFQLNVRTKGVNKLYRYNKNIGHDQIVVAVTWKVENGEIVEETIHSDLEEVSTTVDKGVTEFKEVTRVSVSPNYWETPKGNAHYFFHVDGLVWDKGRPIQFLHGELLNPELHKVRRVLQTLGEQNPIKEDPYGKVWYGFDTNVEEEVIFKVTNKNNKAKVYTVLVDK